MKIGDISQINQMVETTKTTQTSSDFKFTLSSAIGDVELQARIEALMNDIAVQGERIAKHIDIRDLKRYRELIRELMNEIVTHSYEFSRENFLDRRGRHRVYGIVRNIDKTIDELAEVLLADEKDRLAILKCIGEIEGLILDIFT